MPPWVPYAREKFYGYMSQFKTPSDVVDGLKNFNTVHNGESTIYCTKVNSYIQLMYWDRSFESPIELDMCYSPDGTHFVYTYEIDECNHLSIILPITHI